MVQAVSGRSLTAGSRVQCQVSSCNIFDGQSLGWVFLPVLLVSYDSIITPVPEIRRQLHVPLARTNGRSLGTFQKAVLWKPGGGTAYERSCTFFF